MALQGFHFVDIPDGMDMVSRPYDVVGHIGGKYVAIEFKKMTGIKSLPLSQIRDSQWRGLDACEQSGGIALIGIIAWLPHKMKRIYWVSWTDFKARTEGHKSYKKRHLEDDLDYDEWIPKRFTIHGIKKAVRDYCPQSMPQL